MKKCDQCMYKITPKKTQKLHQKVNNFYVKVATEYIFSGQLITNQRK